MSPGIPFPGAVIQIVEQTGWSLNSLQNWHIPRTFLGWISSELIISPKTYFPKFINLLYLLGMAKEPNEKLPFQVSVHPIYEQPSHVTFTNFTRFSHVSSDVILDLGILDDQVLLKKVGTSQDTLALEGAIDVPAYVSHRFGMSLHTFVQMRKNIEEMWNKIKESGIAQAAGIEE